MPDRRPLFALLAEFAEPDDLIHAIEAMREAGYTRMEAYTPFPIDELAEKLAFKDNRVPWAMLIGGILGAVTGYVMQAGLNLDFPLDVGGRPLIATPAFMLIVFELTVLFAVLGGIGTMLICNRLPRLHYPLFDSDRFQFASDDRFFLALFAGREFDAGKAREALAGLSPVSLDAVHESAVE